MKKHLLTPLMAFFFFAGAMKSNAQWSLTGNANATANSVLGTTNSVPLRLFTKNTPRIVIDTLGRVGIGITTPTTQLTVKGSGGTPTAVWTTTGSPVFSGFGENYAGNADFILGMASSKLFNAVPRIIGYRSRGILAVPTAVVSGDQLMAVSPFGYDGTAFQNAAAITFAVDSVQSGADVPTNMVMSTGTTTATRSERLRIGSNGDIALNINKLFVQKLTGYVGVGTTIPAAKLDVSGDALINGISVGRGKGNGLSNTAAGIQALNQNKPAAMFNTAIGFKALFSNNLGSNNTAIGGNTLFTNNNGKNNTANGYGAMQYNTDGIDNTAVGVEALNNNVTGNYNTANGSHALYANTTGFSNAANGAFALYENTTGYHNTATGVSTLYHNTEGHLNTANGAEALYENTTGTDNTAIGYDALFTSSTGNYNTATGSKALYRNTSADANTAHGYEVLYVNTTGSYNTGSGNAALHGNTTGSFNTANGHNALFSNTTADGNTAFGSTALYRNENGSNNTALGSGTNSLVTAQSNTTGLGYDADPTATNSIAVGNTSVTSIKGQVGFTTFSDQRFKKNIKEGEVKGLEFITQLRPVTYNADITAYAKWKEANYGEKDTANWEGKYDVEKIRFSGFLAQEVEATANKIGYDFSGVDKPKNSKDIYGLRYAEFVVPLVKAVQELSIKNDKKDQKIDTLQKQIDDLKAIVNKLVNDKSAMPCPPLAGK